ncbi:MAG: hypothetical protein KJ065_16290 [Anaerolineae bacterium]|nr:hypothetical protein [Anaerolineae bacterium]
MTLGVAMTIALRWDQAAKDTLVFTFNGNWTWQDFYIVSQQAYSNMQEVASAVHIIYELRHGSNIFKNPMLHLRQFTANMPPFAREGLNVYVGATAYWKACVMTFNRVYPELAQDVVYVSTLDDARVAIEKKREQLELLNDDSDFQAAQH